MIHSEVARSQEPRRGCCWKFFLFQTLDFMMSVNYINSLLLNEVISHFVDGLTEATEVKNLDIRLTEVLVKVNRSLKPELKSIPFELLLLSKL